MYTQEMVQVDYPGYTVTATVQLDDGQAIDVTDICLVTDTTSEVHLHQSDLTKHGLRDLFDAAEKAHDAFMEEEA